MGSRSDMFNRVKALQDNVDSKKAKELEIINSIGSTTKTEETVAAPKEEILPKPVINNSTEDVTAKVSSSSTEVKKTNKPVAKSSAKPSKPKASSKSETAPDDSTLPKKIFGFSLDPELHAKVKIAAFMDNTTPSAIVSDLLKEYLAKREK